MEISYARSVTSSILGLFGQLWIGSFRRVDQRGYGLRRKRTCKRQGCRQGEINIALLQSKPRPRCEDVSVYWTPPHLLALRLLATSTTAHVYPYMDSRLFVQELEGMRTSLDCVRIFGFVVMRLLRIEPTWKSARFLLIGLTACSCSLRNKSGSESAGLTYSPCSPVLAQSVGGGVSRD